MCTLPIPLFWYLWGVEKLASENRRQLFLCQSCPNISSTVSSSWQQGLLTVICKYRPGQASTEELPSLVLSSAGRLKRWCMYDCEHPPRGRESVDLVGIKCPCLLRDGAHLDVTHKSQMLSLLSEFILSEAGTWLNLGSRLPSSFIEWSLSSVRGRRRPCQTRLAQWRPPSTSLQLHPPLTLHTLTPHPLTFCWVTVIWYQGFVLLWGGGGGKDVFV